MSSVATATVVADLIELALTSAMRYNALRRQAEADGRAIAMDDVLALQDELRRNQARLDAKLAAMPDDAADPGAGQE